MKIAVIGDGGWGTTLAVHLCKLGHGLRLWGPFPEYAKALDKKRENVKFLPGIKIPVGIKISSDINTVLDGAQLVVFAVPSQYARSVLERLSARVFSGTKFVSATKGIENKSLLRMSELILETLGKVRLAVLSGPSIAYEVARSMPTTVVAASDDNDLAKEIQSVLMTDRFRVYTSSDVIGVELGGSLKNIIAIASGIADGLKLGANSKAAILTRGIRELTRLGVAMGAKKETFSGLSCMGDLITTCMSEHSRNRWLGEELGKGRKAEEIIKSTEMAIEGFATTKSVRDLAQKLKVDMPITNEVYEILYNKKDPRNAVTSLMTRTPKEEL